MSSSLPPWAWITEPRYLKFSTCFRAFPVLSLICRVSAVLAHTIVSVLSAFTLRPLLSKASCHSPNLFWRLVDEISDKIRSSAYSMYHGTSCRTYSLTASMTIINSNGLRQDPWCTPTVISNASVFPHPLLTVVTAPSYIDLITLTSFSLIPFRLRLQYNTSLGTRSRAFSKSTNVQYCFLFPSRIFSCTWRRIVLCKYKICTVLKKHCEHFLIQCHDYCPTNVQDVMNFL